MMQTRTLLALSIAAVGFVLSEAQSAQPKLPLELQVSVPNSDGAERAALGGVPIEFRVHNRAQEKIEFFVMICSFQWNWTTDNKSVTVDGPQACDRNYPGVNTLGPGKSYDGKLVLRLPVLQGSDSISFRLGFAPYTSMMASSSEYTYWSGPITIKAAVLLAPNNSLQRP